MTTINDNFEAAFLNGRSREDVLVSSQFHLGADGEYFNPHIRTLFKFYCQGWEDGCANAAEDIEATGSCEGEPAPEPVEPHDIDPGCWDCKGAGDGDGKGGKCPTCWSHPF